MSNKESFISTYLDNITKKFNINKDQAYEIFVMATMLDKTFDEICANVIITSTSDVGIDVSIGVVV
jgi:hypothetical protein